LFLSLSSCPYFFFDTTLKGRKGPSLGRGRGKEKKKGESKKGKKKIPSAHSLLPVPDCFQEEDVSYWATGGGGGGGGKKMAYWDHFKKGLTRPFWKKGGKGGACTLFQEKKERHFLNPQKEGK